MQTFASFSPTLERVRNVFFFFLFCVKCTNDFNHGSDSRDWKSCAGFIGEKDQKRINEAKMLMKKDQSKTYLVNKHPYSFAGG